MAASPTDAMLFAALSLVLGIGCRHLLRGTRVPYTVALLLLGVALGSIEYGTKHHLGKLGDGIRLWANIDPNLLLAVFLPALLFESSFSMEVHQIKRCIVQMLLLAGPGVLISTFFLGFLVKFTFPYGWSWNLCWLLGGLLSATDPVAVVALLKDLGASKKLNSIIEGESLMNDGTAIVVYTLFYQMVLGKNFNWSDVVKFLARVSLGAVGIGVAFGMACVMWLGFIFNDIVIEISLTLAASYLAYFAAQEGVDVSGVLTVMTLGMFLAAVARTSFKGDGQKSMHHFWEMIAYIANTLIFILSGVVIAEGVLSSVDVFGKHGNSWGFLVLLYIYVQISRCAVVALLYPFLQYFGYGLNWKESVILVWSGLRGAVALSLSLLVKRSGDSSGHLNSETGTLFLFLTGGIVFITLIVNGSTTQFLLQVLDMNRLSEAKRRILDYTMHEMQSRALDTIRDLGDDEELGPADWPTVQRYVSCLSQTERIVIHPHPTTDGYDSLSTMNLNDMRIRLLNAVQAAYWVLLDEGRIPQFTANLLMQSVDEAVDLVSHGPLSDWKGLRSYVRFPSYYKILNVSIFPKKLVTYFIVERLESACYICAAFLRAHRLARRQLHDFFAETEILSAVVNESDREGEEAKKFLEDVRAAFPQVLRAVKTRQVAYSVLGRLVLYVQNLEKIGLLEKKEILHLDNAVQADLKRLLRNPPIVKMPKKHELLCSHPLFGALPSGVCDLIEHSSSEIIKSHGATLYQEGSRANGIFLISNGLVKWTSRILSDKHSLHPILPHGATLGLYEILSEKPYLCNMITDSVVRCFFVEVDRKMLSQLRTDPEVEEFLWQESITVLSKVLVPHIFETIGMQDLRAFVQRSSMMMHIRGETIEISRQTIAFLLEGYIRMQGPDKELITSPAALFPSKSFLDHSDQSLDESGAKEGNRCFYGSSFMVDSRARVISFNISSLENAPLRRPCSLSHSPEPSLSRSGEYGSLMSWPEHLFQQEHHNQNLEGTHHSANILTTKAMQLGIFGSTLDKLWRIRSFPRSIWPKTKSSAFFPQVTINHGRSLPCVRSEGASSMRKALLTSQFSVEGSAGPLQKPALRGAPDDSSEEEDLIVRIDSPSRLSFPQAS